MAEIEQTINIKEKVINLKNIENLQIVELKFSDIDEYLDFLEEDLTEYLKNKLEELKITAEELKVYYDLSYSQGDYFNFFTTLRTNKALIKISPSGRNSEEFNIIEFKINKEFIYYEDLTEKQTLKADKYLTEFKEDYYNLCREMKRTGYSQIESWNEESVLNAGFRRFLEQNDISTTYELYDFNYTTEEKEGYIKICDSGDSYIKGLFIKPFNIKRTYKTIIYKPFIEETNEIL